MVPHAHESVGGDSDAILPHDFEPTFKLNEFAKRMLDIALATTGLILFAPILLISSVAIKIDSHGPVFIRAPLDGDKNRLIQVLKFRVVTRCAENEQINHPLTCFCRRGGRARQTARSAGRNGTAARRAQDCWH